MDPLKRAFYDERFQNRFLECKGEAFQDFFSSLMEARYPGDFSRVRPWGAKGDEGNDGYHRSKRRSFQCYAPRGMKLKVLLEKIEADFKKSLPGKAHFDEWCFVNNDPEGLPKKALDLLLELSTQHSPVKAIDWGRRCLFEDYRGLSEDSLRGFLGEAPSRQDVIRIGLDDVRGLLDHIALQPEALDADLRPVPPEKLRHNQLSPNVGILMKAGMSRADVVGKYFRGLPDQARYDRIAGRFRERYGELKAEGRTPDEIFARLQSFVSGDESVSASIQAATLAVLAFFFEACEIFERPPESEGGTG